MSDSPQDVYAKHLLHAGYGYPLRIPEPRSTLPDYYQDSGLQVGDVGTVDRDGQFDVLFNIYKCKDNLLHDRRGVPKNFQPIKLQGDINSRDNVIPPRPIHSRGIERILESNKQSSVDYEFKSSVPAGAILILPHGAKSQQLSSPEQLREVATKSALDWYEFAQTHCDVRHHDRSLYLVTGFYKTPSWSLGSFNDPASVEGTIQARKDGNSYLLDFTFVADHRRSCPDGDTMTFNQTVFITGFKITISSWLSDPVVLRVTESETPWSILARLFKACLNWLPDFSSGYKQHGPISVEHKPSLSQPFHPSDIINRFLLSKEPNAKVAITHDSDWMDMLKGGLTHEELLHEDSLGMFLAKHYSISVDSQSENTTVFLQGKADDTMNSVSSIVDPRDSSPELEFLPPTPTLDNPWIVITNIRAQNILSDLKRMPVGFYVLVQSDRCQKKTRNKSMRLSDSGIEWEDEILLPSEVFENVRFTLYASFELQPMLGSGEVLYSSETCVEEFVGGTHLITFSPEELGGPSLLLTLARRYSNHLAVAPSGDDSNLDFEESSVFVLETNLGQQALLRYHNIYQREDLESAVQRFECARCDCPLTHRCRAAVLVNVAKAKFISYQADPTSADLDEVILLYREALSLRSPGHPDRPATLLLLARTLLFRYEKQGCDESVADEINELVSKSQNFSEDSHERRAADLVLETLERYRIVKSGSLSELDGLVHKLEHSAKVPPDGYFDIPQRLINLSTTLWRRYEKRGELDDLNYSLDINQQALQMLPARDPGRLAGLRTLGAALWRLFELRRDLSYLRELIALDEEALQLIPEGHPERPYWVTNYKSHRAEMLEYFGNTAFEARKYDEAIAQYSQAVKVLRSSSS